MVEKPETAKEWWRSFHVIEMADLFLERPDPKPLIDSIEFLRRELDLSAGAQVYDQCCGIGTLGFELAEFGVNTVGADLCDVYIDRARARAGEAGHERCTFHCADAFEFVPQQECDAVINWYSSFGYAATNRQNIKMIQRASDALKPGGYYALDLPHFPTIIRGFQRFVVRSGQSGGSEVTCVRESRFDLVAGQLVQTWNWIVDGKPTVQKESALRIYFPHEIGEMLRDSGFESIQMFGCTQKSRLQLDSPRLIVVARKST